MEGTGLDRVVDGVRQLATVKRVYGEPYEKDGLTVIPAASVRAGGGGGGSREQGEETGLGGGFGFVARPSGAWIIEGGNVTWRPAVDVNRVVLGGQLLTLAGFLAAAVVLDRRLKRREEAETGRGVEMLARLASALRR